MLFLYLTDNNTASAKTTSASCSCLSDHKRTLAMAIPNEKLQQVKRLQQEPGPDGY